MGSSFISSVPVLITMFFLLNIAFRLTFREKYSKVFRKYSFLPLLLLMITEGNVEQFTFLIIDELMEFFSASYGHKVVNAFILLVFFLIIFCSTGFYLFCWSYYRKKVAYLTENITFRVSAIFAFTLDRGIFCLLLGAAHRLLIDETDLQLMALGFI